MIRFLNFIKTHWIPVTVVTLACITVLSLRPLETLPDVPGIDKLHHLIAYAFLAIPVALRKPRRWIGICVLFIAYSGGIELLQPFVNRYCELKDLLANTAGVACGVIIAVGLGHFFSQESRKTS